MVWLSKAQLQVPSPWDGGEAGGSGAGLPEVGRGRGRGLAGGGGECSWSERERKSVCVCVCVLLILGLEVTAGEGLGWRPGNPDIPSLPPKVSVEHPAWIGTLGPQVPQRCCQ